jgi:hypothetical protein
MVAPSAVCGEQNESQQVERVPVASASVACLVPVPALDSLRHVCIAECIVNPNKSVDGGGTMRIMAVCGGVWRSAPLLLVMVLF